MKLLFAIITLCASTSFGQTQVLETVCRNQDCFKYGWVTTSKGYVLETECKKHDCTKHGWLSVGNDKSIYDVTCRAGGCFVDGWHSSEDVKRRHFYDDATCKNSDCLKNGWTVRTGFDFFGGNVSCNQNDCSKFGGLSVWRGRPSKTQCYNDDCYKNGWTLYIY